jgi:hypothetical protein
MLLTEGTTMQLDIFTETPAATKSPTSRAKTNNLSASLRQHTANIDTALQGIFKSTHEETRLQQARRIMGSSLDDLSDEELEVCLTEFQHMLDEWFDAFECDVFDSQTLKQVLGQA